MSKNQTTYRYLFAGGGTGGHLYPAIAVAQKLLELQPNSNILFVGTKKKIEARVLPNLGFEFKSIWISGITRKITLKNLLFPIKLVVSLFQSLLISIKFKPDIAIGTGAYVSGPAIWGASMMGARIVLMEQNSYPGLANRLLEKKAEKVFVSFEESSKYFRDSSKLINSGNPIRVDIQLQDRLKAIKEFGLDESRKTLVIIGGSLGARSINIAIEKNLNELKSLGIQILWQTGENYFEKYQKYDDELVRVQKYFDNISLTYSIANLLIVRAGATTIAEVAALGLPVVFVPSPNVAEDHQFKNAKVLYDSNAAELVKDNDFSSKVIEVVKDLMFNEQKLNGFKENIKKFAKPDAVNIISNEIIKMAANA